MSRRQSGLAPAAGTSDTARMVDVQSALSAYNPIAATRKSYYSFGGATNTSQVATTGKGTAERTRFVLPVQPTRYRLHVRNYVGLGDYTPSGSVTVTGAFVGMQSTSPATPWDYAAAPTSLGAASAAITGLTEFVTPWATPTYDMAANESLLSTGYTYATGSEIAYGNGSHSITIDDASLAGTTTSINYTPGGGGSATYWYDYNYTVMEQWIEYEFQDDSARIGLAIGHSMVDGTQFQGANTPGWDGQMTGWPQQMARRAKHAVTVNAFATSKTSDWNSATSTKWTSRFTDLVPDYAIIMITENDIVNTAGITAATIDTNLRAIINIVGTRYPSAAIFVGTPMPIKPASADADGSLEAIRQQVMANVTALSAGGLIRGVLDFGDAIATSRAVTTASGTGTPAAATYTTSVVRDTVAARWLGADGQHLNTLGMSRLAQVALMAGNSLQAVSPPRGPLSFTPAVGSLIMPQGVVTTGVATSNALSAVYLVPMVVGPQPINADALALNVTTAYSATATTVAVGLYRAGPDGMPVLVGGPIASGTLSLNAAAAGAKTVPFTAAVTLTPGVYWVAHVLTGTAATAGAVTCVANTGYAIPTTAFVTAAGKYLQGTSAGLPSTAVALTVGTGTTNAPLLLLRRSA